MFLDNCTMFKSKFLKHALVWKLIFLTALLPIKAFALVPIIMVAEAPAAAALAESIAASVLVRIAARQAINPGALAQAQSTFAFRTMMNKVMSKTALQAQKSADGSITLGNWIKALAIGTGASFLIDSSGGTKMTISPSGISTSKTVYSVPFSQPALSSSSSSFGWVHVAPPSALEPVFSSSGAAIANYMSRQWPNTHTMGACYTDVNGVPYCDLVNRTTASISGQISAQKYIFPAGSNINCTTGGWDGTKCVSPNLGSVVLAPQTSTTTTPSTSGITLTSSQGMEGLTPRVIADISNSVWQQVSNDPGYVGPKYDPAYPITPTEVESVYVPTTDLPLIPRQMTMNDILAGNSPSDFKPSPYPTTPGETGNTPSTAPTSDTTESTSQDPTVEPVYGSPTLEAIPTIQMILDPIFNILPGFRTYQVPTHEITCPPFAVQFDFMGKSFGGSYNYHCQFAADNRTLIRSGMIIGFGIAAIFIVLGA